MKLITKTPIWTGNIERESLILKSTGIIGSLRYWSEAILRGKGEFVCDPTIDGLRCPDTINKIKHYCTNCLIFGATDLRRSFKIDMNGGNGLFDEIINIKPHNRSRGWYLSGGIYGEFDFDIIPLNSFFDPIIINYPLKFINQMTAIGARTQHGYGVIQGVEVHEANLNYSNYIEKLELFKEEWKKQFGSDKFKIRFKAKNQIQLPNIRDMFFAVIQFEVKNKDWWKQVDGIKNNLEYNPKLNQWIDSNIVPTSPAIRNWLRYGSTGSPFSNSIKDNNWFFGTVQGAKYSTKISISNSYPVTNTDNMWEFRIWGWIPKTKNQSKINREKFLNDFKSSLARKGSVKIPWDGILGDQTINHQLVRWREFDSDRDNQGKISDFTKFMNII